jgi:hypothetical protein
MRLLLVVSDESLLPVGCYPERKSAAVEIPGSGLDNSNMETEDVERLEAVLVAG